MDRFPHEILCAIFLLALPYPIHPDTYDESRGSITVPLYISHVCRTWRNISISLRELWSYLNFFQFKGSTIKVFDTWLERTNGAALNFRVECDPLRMSDMDAPLHHQEAEYVITTLVSQQHRWREVKFVWAGVRVSSEFPGLLKLTNMPMLESLSLSMEMGHRASISIERSSRLKCFIVRGDAFDLETGDHVFCELGDIRFTWPVRTASDVLRIWLNFLRAAPNLKEFRTSSYPSDGDSPPSYRTPFIILPDLHALDLRSSFASYILDYVTLPRLRSLYFVSGSDGVDDYMETRVMLLNFFRRSLPPLTSLRIFWYRAHEDSIIQLLSLLPTLKHLRLVWAMGSRRFLDALTISNETNANSNSYSALVDRTGIDTAVCPALETLFIERFLFEEDEDPCPAFIAMLRSREKASGKLWDIHFRDDRSGNLPDPLVVTRFGFLVEEEDNSEFRRRLRHHLSEQGVVIGNYDVVDSILS